MHLSSIVLLLTSLIAIVHCKKFIAFDNRIGYLADESMDFVSAKQFCRKSRTHFPFVTSTKEAAYLTEVFKLSGYENVWLLENPEDDSIMDTNSLTTDGETPVLCQGNIFSLPKIAPGKVICIMEKDRFKQLEKLTIEINHDMNDAFFLQLSFAELNMKETQRIRSIVIYSGIGMVSFIVFFFTVIILVIRRSVKKSVICHMAQEREKPIELHLEEKTKVGIFKALAQRLSSQFKRCHCSI